MYEHADEFINRMDSAISRAKKKHPGFVMDNYPVYILSEELGEVAQAINDNQPDKAMDELLDLAAVAYRFYHLLRRQKLDKEAKK